MEDRKNENIDENVRRFCRNKYIVDKSKSQKYHELMKSLPIASEQEYDQLKRELMGGFSIQEGSFYGR